MSRILFGFIAPIFITLVVWFIGNPPALSLFWDTADGTVVGYDTYEAETGFGLYTFNVPLVEIDSKAKTLRVNLPDAAEMNDVKVDWPMGKSFRFKINPPLSKAYAQHDPRFSYIVPIVVLTIALVIVGMTFASYFTAFDTLSSVFAAVGIIFTAIPLFIVIFRWQVGYPPPIAHLVWPSETAEIVSQEIVSRRIGNGTIQHTPVVTVRLPNIAEPMRVDGYRGGFRKEADQVLERLGVGKMMKVNISPAGVPFEAKWDFQQIVTVIITCLLPLFIFIGMAFLRIALLSLLE